MITQVGGATALLVFALGLCGGAASPAAGSIVPHETRPGQVNRVVDGSSLDARVDGNRTLVSYLGVSTPTLSEPCGAEALARNAELVGSGFLAEEDPGYGFDARGRRLYYVFTDDGLSVDEVLIREGLGYAVRTDARHGGALQDAELEAMRAGRGCLWATNPDPSA